MNNGVGRTPLGWLGERVALGTDGIGSDMFEEGRTGYFRRREEELATGPDWALRRLASARGSRTRLRRAAAGPDRGRRAGRSGRARLRRRRRRSTRATLAGHWIFGLGAAHVRDVIVAGELVVATGA
jgi:cytosine/adenosine deaminase-related metal-dependent hydrolase